MFDGDRNPSYIRAFLTVAIFYGLALVLNYLESDTIFRVSLREHNEDQMTWPLLLAFWWMVILHLPLPAYFWWKGVRVNRYFSNENVFQVLFAIWYGCIAGMAFIVVSAGAKYGWLAALGLLLVIVAARRGERLRRLVEYGSTCASFFVFYRASGDVPPQYWLACYVGIGIVQCAFLALLEIILTEIFEPVESPDAVPTAPAADSTSPDTVMPEESESPDRRK